MNTAKIVIAFFLGAIIFSYISFNHGVKLTNKTVENRVYTYFGRNDEANNISYYLQTGVLDTVYYNQY